MILNLAKHVLACARTDPSRLAVTGEGVSLSYGELARHAANLAFALRASGLGRSGGAQASKPPMVGIIATRSIDACVAVLGCAWAGATYVPIGTKLPESRLHRLMSVCALSAIVTDVPGARLLPAALRGPNAPSIVITPRPAAVQAAASAGLQLFNLHALPDASPWPDLHAFEPDDLAYVMFTSGTTGTPKGVMISQASVDAFVTMIGERLQLTPDDRTLEVTELGFDVSVLDMFATWQARASLHTLPAARVMNAVTFAREQRLTIWSSTPSLIGLLKQIKALGPNSLPDVRLAILIGEPVSASTLATLREAAPNCIVEDLYGPTEATVVCTGQRIEREGVFTPKRDVLSIGEPLPGNRAAIVNAAGEFLPAGEVGELVLAGIQLATGYLGAPELTAARFPILAGERWYLTGDSAYRDERGLFHHLGRIDNQVKILGNRVELDEIETHLREVSGRELVAAVPWPTRDGIHHGVVAFIGGENAGNDASVLSGLSARMPAYMLPSRLIWVESMPVNSNGKTDRRALLETLPADEGG